MEYTKNERAIVEQTADAAKEEEYRELNDLELSLIGGGSGEVVFH